MDDVWNNSGWSDAVATGPPRGPRGFRRPRFLPEEVLIFRRGPFHVAETEQGRWIVATRTKYEHGVFSWTTLTTPDPAAAKRFYGGVFGWQFEDMPAGPEQTYTFARLGKESVAGLSGLTKEMIAQ